MRNKVVMAFTLSLVLGLVNFYRPKETVLNVHCDENATVNFEYRYGRFANLTEKFQMLSEAMPVPQVDDPSIPIRGNYAALEQTPDKGTVFSTISLSKINIVNSISFECEGLKHALLVFKDGSPVKKVPITLPTTVINRSDFSGAPGNWTYWLLGLSFFSLLFFMLIIEIDKFRKTESLVDKAIIITIISFLISSVLYYFPSYITPMNPTAVIGNAQIGKIEGWEGILYSILINSVYEFIPKVPAGIIPLNIVIFFFLKEFIFLGRNLKQRVVLFAAVALCFLLNTALYKYMQYFERANFSSWCFALLAVKIFHYQVFKSDRKKFDPLILVVGAFLLSLIRNEYVLVTLPFIYFLFEGRIRRISYAAIFVLSFIFVNRGLDQFDSLGNGWKFRYYVVSLSGYIHKIVNTHQITDQEKKDLSYYFEMETMQDANKLWSSVKQFPPGKLSDIKVITDIIWKYFQKDPMSLVVSRAAYAASSLGLIDFFPPWFYTPPSKNFYGSNVRYFNVILTGMIKIPGDPFYSSIDRVYQQQNERLPFLLSFGIIFILSGVVFFRRLPATSLICVAVIIKLTVVALLAPTRSFVYVLDGHLMCALIVFMAWIEWKARSIKVRIQS